MTQLHADEVSSYVAALQALKNDDRLRSLKPRTGIEFSSNDYLALASVSLTSSSNKNMKSRSVFNLTWQAFRARLRLNVTM